MNQLATWPSWRWPYYVGKDYALETWRAMPGPTWCKLALVAICVAIPGPQDELILLAFIKACRIWQARRQAKQLAAEVSK